PPAGPPPTPPSAPATGGSSAPPLAPATTRPPAGGGTAPFAAPTLVAGRGLGAGPPDPGVAGSPGAQRTRPPAAGAGPGDSPACPQPRITYTPPFALSPGSYVAVTGCGFGDRVQEMGLVLKLQTDKVEVPLVVTEWHDRWIAATVPAGLAGLL